MGAVFAARRKRSLADFATSRWPEELPSAEEYAEAQRNLDVCGWEVDYIITHSPPSSLAERLGCPQDELTDFLEEIRQKASYRRWMFGHCHGDQARAFKPSSRGGWAVGRLTRRK